MKSIDDIVKDILETTEYPREVVEFHVVRLARKFKYELSGKHDNILSKQDAIDVVSIASRFFQDRKGHEARREDATQLLYIIPVSTSVPVKRSFLRLRKRK